MRRTHFNLPFRCGDLHLLQRLEDFVYGYKPGLDRSSFASSFTPRLQPMSHPQIPHKTALPTGVVCNTNSSNLKLPRRPKRACDSSYIGIGERFGLYSHRIAQRLPAPRVAGSKRDNVGHLPKAHPTCLLRSSAITSPCDQAGAVALSVIDGCDVPAHDSSHVRYRTDLRGRNLMQMTKKRWLPSAHISGRPSDVFDFVGHSQRVTAARLPRAKTPPA